MSYLENLVNFNSDGNSYYYAKKVDLATFADTVQACLKDELVSAGLDLNSLFNMAPAARNNAILSAGLCPADYEF